MDKITSYYSNDYCFDGYTSYYDEISYISLVKLCLILECIKKQVEKIEDKLSNSAVKKVKKQIKNIDHTLITFGFEIKEIRKEFKNALDMLNNPRLGIEEVKEKIVEIINTTDDTNFELEDIKEEMAAIIDRINNPAFGFKEIKKEVKNIQKKIDSFDLEVDEVKNISQVSENHLDEHNLFEQTETIFDNSRKIIEMLLNEKKMLESVFLDNRIPEQFKKDLLTSYKTLGEVYEKRTEFNNKLKKTKSIVNSIGILHNKKQKTYIDNITIYLKMLSENKNMSILCFTIDNLDLQQELVSGDLIDKEGIKQCTTSIPPLIYNIGCYSKYINIKKIKHLYMVNNIIIVNPVNRFNQMVIFDILNSLSCSKNFLQSFEKFSPSALKKYLKKYNSIFLIPEKEMIKRLIIKVFKNPDSDNKYIIDLGNNHQTCTEKKLFQNIKNMTGNNKFIIMKGFNTLNWNNVPLESRVYAQKDITGKWTITEMIAKNEIFLNNSIYKDTVDELTRVLLNIIPDQTDIIIEKLSNYTKNICSYLDYYFSELGSCTLDFALDETGNPYIFNFSGWEQKDFLFMLNNNDSWLNYLYKSIDYLIYLGSKNQN